MYYSKLYAHSYSNLNKEAKNNLSKELGKRGLGCRRFDKTLPISFYVYLTNRVWEETRTVS